MNLSLCGLRTYRVVHPVLRSFLRTLPPAPAWLRTPKGPRHSTDLNAGRTAIAAGAHLRLVVGTTMVLLGGGSDQAKGCSGSMAFGWSSNEESYTLTWNLDEPCTESYGDGKHAVSKPQKNRESVLVPPYSQC